MMGLVLLRQLARIGGDDLGLPLIIADLPSGADPLAVQSDLRGPEFLAMFPVDGRSEGRIGVRLPRSKNVGCDRELAAYLADATTPQTVAVSPRCFGASPGLTDAALVEKADRLSTAHTTNNAEFVFGSPISLFAGSE